jgi:hypothetical protein
MRSVTGNVLRNLDADGTLLLDRIRHTRQRQHRKTQQTQQPHPLQHNNNGSESRRKQSPGVLLSHCLKGQDV